MKNLLVATAIMMVLGSCSQPKRKLAVVEVDDGMKIVTGDALLNTDKVFKLDSQTYVIRTRDFFDVQGEMTHAMTWDAIGYVNWARKDIKDVKLFSKEHEMLPKAEAYIIKDNHLLINGDTIMIRRIDLKGEIIYYMTANDLRRQGPQHLHRLIFK